MRELRLQLRELAGKTRSGLRRLPTATECLDEGDVGVPALAAEPGGGAFYFERGALGINHFKIADEAHIVPRMRQVSAATSAGDRTGESVTDQRAGGTRSAHPALRGTPPTLDDGSGQPTILSTRLPVAGSRRVSADSI